MIISSASSSQQEANNNKIKIQAKCKIRCEKRGVFTKLLLKKSRGERYGKVIEIRTRSKSACSINKLYEI